MGIWLAFAVSNIIGAIIAYVWYQRGTWRDVDLTESKVDADNLAVDVLETDD